MMRSTSAAATLRGATQSSSRSVKSSRPTLSPASSADAREAGGDVGGAFAQGLLAGAEVGGAGDVDGQDQRELAFLAVQADERLARARRHVPVHRAHVVAGDVFAQPPRSRCRGP
jgi:hypothetical protein